MIKILVIISLLSTLAFADIPESPAQTILITASTGALGSSIAKTFAAKGYNLILAGRDEVKLAALKKSIGEKAEIITFDYNNIAQMTLVLDKLKDSSIDGIVLIAPRPYFKSKQVPDPQEWRRNFESSFIGPLEFIRLAENKIKSPAAIVIISGETSKTYLPAYPNTNVIRLMWSGEVKNLCHQYSDRAIRVNAISPGIILTEHNINKIKERGMLAQKNFNEQLVA